MAAEDTGRRALPSLTALRAFEAVGRVGSVRSAADELHVSHTVVSRHLKLLQSSVGAQLIKPSGRSIVLTEVGSAFHGEVAKAFSILNAAAVSLRSSSRPNFEFWCIPGIVNRRLLPRLPELRQGLRRFEVNIQPTLAMPRLVTGEADAALVFAEGPVAHAELRAEDIVTPRIFPVASPAFLDRHPISSLDDLLAAPLLHEESTRHWASWLRRAGLARDIDIAGQCLWHALIAIDAARLGQGVALANELLVEEELRAGTLREVLRTSVHAGAYRLLCLRSRWDDAAMRRLRDWLRAALVSQTA